MKLLEGQVVADRLLRQLYQKVGVLKRPPGLSFILIGDHPPSHTYVTMKRRRCAEVGIVSKVYTLEQTVSENHLLQLLYTLNQDPFVDGILVQQPLPSSMSTSRVVEAIDPLKDVDGLHPCNLGKLMIGDPTGFIPCTPLGIQTLLESYQISLEGKKVVIVGRSTLVGKPLALLLLQKRAGANATVTVAHTGTPHLSDLTRSADVVVAALGKPLFIKPSMLKPGAVVIDVGINRLGSKVVGDVEKVGLKEVASYITPVPGGIGPMTIAMLLSNTVLAYERKEARASL